MQGLLVNVASTFPEADEKHFFGMFVAFEELFGFRNRDVCGTFHRKPICAGTDRWKSECSDGVLCGDGKATPVATCQEFVFISVTVTPDRTDGMNDPFGWQPVTFGDFGLARGPSAQFSAFFQHFGPGCAVDCSINSAPAQQCCVRRINNRVDLLPGDVTFDYKNPVGNGSTHRRLKQLKGRENLNRETASSEFCRRSLSTEAPCRETMTVD